MEAVPLVLFFIHCLDCEGSAFVAIVVTFHRAPSAVGHERKLSFRMLFQRGVENLSESRELLEQNFFCPPVWDVLYVDVVLVHLFLVRRVVGLRDVFFPVSAFVNGTSR